MIPCSTANQDSQPPTIPGNVSVNVVNYTQVDVSWNNSIDNVGVAGYIIYRDGVAIGDVASGITSFRDNELLPEMSFRFTVKSYNMAGNYSGQSNPVIVSTTPLPDALIIPIEADTYVNASNPTSNYGRSTSLRMDASPNIHSYLKFNVNGLAGYPIYNARLSNLFKQFIKYWL